MLGACVAALACLSLVRYCAAAEPHMLRAHAHFNKDLIGTLAAIEERLRVLDTISAVQAKQSRRLDIIQNKLDRVETSLSLKLDRAQLAVERIEHRLLMLETSVQTSIKQNTEQFERSHNKVIEAAQNLTNHLDSHRHLLEKVSGAYVETWRRGLVLESLMRDGQSLINATRRELADGLRALARRQRDARLSPTELEAIFSRRMNNSTYKIDSKMQEMLEVQKRFVDTCQRVQLDDPNHVADVLDKMIDSFINKTASTFRELQSIQTTMRNHDSKVTKILNSGRNTQSEVTCRRLEAAFRNASHGVLKETELHSLTEKFVALTNKADAALQRLDARLGGDSMESASDVDEAADCLVKRLNGMKVDCHELEDNDSSDIEDDDQYMGYFDDGNEGDIMDEDKKILSGVNKNELSTSAPVLTPHRRHLHKHPYDRGPG